MIRLAAAARHLLDLLTPSVQTTPHQCSRCGRISTVFSRSQWQQWQTDRTPRCRCGGVLQPLWTRSEP